MRTPLALWVACLASFAAHADEVSCARISEGTTSLAILRLCGQPALVDSRQEEWHADDGTVLQVDSVERWTYDLGPERLVRIFKLRNGIVTAATTGGYGTSRQGLRPRDCSGARISVGDLKQDVLVRCGQPTASEVHAEARERGARTVYDTVEDWVYDLGPAIFVRTFTFRNGRLQQIQTGGYGTNYLSSFE
jgi:hypothetical protein